MGSGPFAILSATDFYDGLEDLVVVIRLEGYVTATMLRR